MDANKDLIVPQKYSGFQKKCCQRVIAVEKLSPAKDFLFSNNIKEDL